LLDRVPNIDLTVNPSAEDSDEEDEKEEDIRSTSTESEEDQVKKASPNPSSKTTKSGLTNSGTRTSSRSSAAGADTSGFGASQAFSFGYKATLSSVGVPQLDTNQERDLDLSQTIDRYKRISERIKSDRAQHYLVKNSQLKITPDRLVCQWCVTIKGLLHEADKEKQKTSGGQDLRCTSICNGCSNLTSGLVYPLCADCCMDHAFAVADAAVYQVISEEVNSAESKEKAKGALKRVKVEAEKTGPAAKKARKDT
jgi:hypothetical protein